MLEIIRNYYEDVKIIIFEIDNKLRKNIIYKIKAEKFRGITYKELYELDKLLLQIKNKKNFFYIFKKNYFNIKYINEITNFNNTHNLYLYKYLIYINKIYNELNKINNINNINIIKESLLQKQLDYFILKLCKTNLLQIL